VRGTSTSLLATDCFPRIRQHVVGGGTTTYCLKAFHGEPGPKAVVRDSGVMTFGLEGGTIRTSVHVVERFAADGAHAQQTLAGKITGGTGVYGHIAGTVKGGGPLVESRRGHLVSSNLRYVLRL